MGRVSVREGISNYVKNLIKDSGVHIILVLVFLGISTTAVYKYITHTSSKLKQNVELIDMMNFNQQIIEENNRLRELNNKQGIQIQQMDMFIQQMYRRLQQHEQLPDLESDKGKPKRSEA
jgi:hypothetical protein